MKSFKIYFSVFLLFSFCDLFSQEKTMYHEFEPTASDFRIINWDINIEHLPDFYLIEKIDSNNRVTEIRFYEKGNNDFKHLCYLSNWIRFEYPNKQTIIQYNLNQSEIPEANIECENPSKVIYHLSSNGRNILKTEYEYQQDYLFFTQNGWTEAQIDSLQKDLIEHQGNSLFIEYYDKSFAKMDGLFPIGSGFRLDNFYFNEVEGQRIKIGLACHNSR